MTVAHLIPQPVLKRTLAAGLGLLAVGMVSATAVSAQGVMPMPSLTAHVVLAADENAPTATLQLAGGDVAAGIGFSWANGIVDFQGVKHRFHVSGLSVADVGAMKINAVGEVYNLRTLADFDGTYAAVSAGASLGGGAGIEYLRNQNGVVIKINSTSQGFNVHLAADGMRIKLQS